MCATTRLRLRPQITNMSDEIINYLESLGIDSEGAKLYKTLAMRGPLTLLQISRLTHIERTKLYRSIQGWIDEGIIEEEMSFKTKLFRAAPVERMKLFVMQKKASIDALAGSFSAFGDQVLSLRQHIVTTKVLHYSGRDGARQMLWNQMKAQGEQMSYVCVAWEVAVGYTFFNNWASVYRQSGIHNRELRHPDMLKTRDDTKVLFKDLGPTYEWRSISPNVLNITHSMELYNDVTAISYWNEDDFTGIELYNKHIAEMQKSIFNHYWKLAGKK